MCLIIFAYDCHPQYQLIMAANRDEFYKRPDLPAAFWPENPTILAGKDLKQGGTWTGITTTGRIAALTNYRNPSSVKKQAPSRGYLVQNYLSGNLAPESYLDNLADGGADYNGFNLLVGTYESLYHYSNREMVIRRIEKGVHGLSNSLLDTPWPKVTRGVKMMTDYLQHEDIEAEQLFQIMADREQPDDHELPQTGVSLEFERILAPAYVVSPDYGTKLTTVLLIDRNRNVQFWERTFKPDNSNQWSEVYHNFRIG